MDVKCTSNRPCDPDGKLFPDLTYGNVYAVIGIEGNYYRLLGDHGLPFLYHKSRFDVTDPEKEPDWIGKTDELIGEIWYPERLMDDGIFEDYFSYNSEAMGSVIVTVSKMSKRRTDALYDPKYDELLVVYGT
jgi:hypothetical protein